MYSQGEGLKPSLTFIARLPSPGSADILSDNAPLFFATNPDTDARLAFDWLNSGI